MLLFYLRHGDPIYEPDSLTPLGHKQAEALAKRLALYGVDEIYCSSSIRAQQTAKPTCDLLRKEMTILNWCHEDLAWKDFTIKREDDSREWPYADNNYRSLFASPKITSLGPLWYEAEELKGYRFQEGVARIQKETYSFIQSLGYHYERESNNYTAIAPNEKRVALFAHEGFGMAFLSTLLGIPYPVFCVHFGLGHSTMTVIQFRGETNIVPEVLQLSNDSHLYKDGIPIHYRSGVQF